MTDIYWVSFVYNGAYWLILLSLNWDFLIQTNYLVVLCRYKLLVIVKSNWISFELSNEYCRQSFWRYFFFMWRSLIVAGFAFNSISHVFKLVIIVESIRHLLKCVGFIIHSYLQAHEGLYLLSSILANRTFRELFVLTSHQSVWINFLHIDFWINRFVIGFKILE